MSRHLDDQTGYRLSVRPLTPLRPIHPLHNRPVLVREHLLPTPVDAFGVSPSMPKAFRLGLILLYEFVFCIYVPAVRRVGPLQSKILASSSNFVTVRYNELIYIRRLDDINVQACACDSLYRTITKFSFLLF